MSHMAAGIVMGRGAAFNVLSEEEDAPPTPGIPADADIFFAPSDFSAGEVTTYNNWVAANNPSASTLTRAPDSNKPNTLMLFNPNYVAPTLNAADKFFEIYWQRTAGINEHAGCYFAGSDVGPGTTGASNNRILHTRGHMHSQGFEFRVPSAYITRFDTDHWLLTSQHANTANLPNPWLAQELQDPRKFITRIRGDNRTAAAFTQPYQTLETLTLISTVIADRWYKVRYQFVNDHTIGGDGLVRIWIDDVQVVNYSGQCGYHGSDFSMWWGSYVGSQWTTGQDHNIHRRNIWYRYDGPV